MFCTVIVFVQHVLVSVFTFWIEDNWIKTIYSLKLVSFSRLLNKNNMAVRQLGVMWIQDPISSQERLMYWQSMSYILWSNSFKNHYIRSMKTEDRATSWPKQSVLFKRKHPWTPVRSFLYIVQVWQSTLSFMKHITKDFSK